MRAGTSAGTWSECATTNTGRGASRSEAGSWKAGCRTFGLRLKRPGTRWSRRGANAMLALKGCVMNLRLPGPLDWKANQAVAA